MLPALVQIVVERIKNRMDTENSNVHNIFGGYRDVSLNIRIVNDVTMEMGLDLHVCELRLVLQCFAEVVRVSFCFQPVDRRDLPTLLATYLETFLFPQEDKIHSNYLKLRNELGWLPVL